MRILDQIVRTKTYFPTQSSHKVCAQATLNTINFLNRFSYTFYTKGHTYHDGF